MQFNGTPAPLIYTSATQIAAQVQDSASDIYGLGRVTVTFAGRTSASIPINLGSYNPGVFTLDFTGKGQAVALNKDGAINTASMPARVGDVISLYVTGVRQGDGPLFVTIGDQKAILTSTKNLLTGVMQIDARIPGGIPTGSAVPVLVIVGEPNSDTDSGSQPGVTIAVR